LLLEEVQTTDVEPRFAAGVPIHALKAAEGLFRLIANNSVVTSAPLDSFIVAVDGNA
jgi:hypothetical protein